MKLRSTFFALSLSALVFIGTSAVAHAQQSETVAFTVNNTVTIGSKTLQPGRYSIHAYGESRALVVRDAATNRFVTFVLPTSVDQGNGQLASLELNRDDEGAEAIRSVYFPAESRTYYFKAPQAGMRTTVAAVAIRTLR